MLGVCERLQVEDKKLTKDSSERRKQREREMSCLLWESGHDCSLSSGDLRIWSKEHAAGKQIILMFARKQTMHGSGWIIRHPQAT